MSERDKDDVSPLEENLPKPNSRESFRESFIGEPFKTYSSLVVASAIFWGVGLLVMYGFFRFVFPLLLSDPFTP